MRPSGAVTRPTGTITFLFTDIVGSTRLWEGRPDAMRLALQQHDRMVLACAEEHGGYTFTNAGDSWGIAFADPRAAVTCALALQEGIAEADWGDIESLHVRLVLDTGLVDEREGDYFGPPLNRIGRIIHQTRGGEVVMTSTTAALVRHDLPPGMGLTDLGSFRLRGLPERGHLYRLESSRRPWTVRARLQQTWWFAITLGLVTVTVLAILGVIDGDETAAPTSTTLPGTTTTAATLPEPTITAVWTAYGETALGAPTVASGRVFAGDRSGALLAFDLETGEPVWNAPVRLPSEILGSPAVDGGNVFAVDRRGALLSGYAISDGHRVMICPPVASPASPPAAGAGRVFVVSAETPQVWAYPSRPTSPEACRGLDSVTTAIKAFGAVEHAPVLTDHTLLVVDAAGTIHAFDARDLRGGERWQFNVVFEGETDTSLYAVRVAGPVMLDYKLPNPDGLQTPRSWVLVGEERVRGESVAWRVMGTDLATGTERIAPIPAGGPPAAGLGRMFVASEDRSSLLVYDHDLMLERTLDVGMGEPAPLVVPETNRLYVVSPDQTITAFDAVTLERVWSHPFERVVTGLGSGGELLLVLDDAGRLTALAED